MTRTVNDNIAIFDIDGCISDDEWRRARIPEGATHPLQYDFYHAGCQDDPPLPIGAELLRQHIANGDFIAFATARPFKVCEMTSAWIQKLFRIEPTKDFMILMRKDDDGRSAIEVKSEFIKYIEAYCQESGRKVVAAYDDRDDITWMYNGKGFDAALVNKDGVFPIADKRGNVHQMVEQSGVNLDNATLPDAMFGVQHEADWTAGEPATPFEQRSAAHILAAASETFRTRNAQYKDNAVIVGKVMEILFPMGVQIQTQADHHFYHLFELMIVKLTRFTNSGLKHVDSLHDLMVYAAMCETIISKHNITEIPD